MSQLHKPVTAIILSSLILSAPAFAFSSKPSESAGNANATVAAADSSIWITRSDGSQSCSIKIGQTVEAGAEDLKNAGIPVLNAQKSTDGKMHIQMCGAPTGALNAYQIRREDLPKAMAMGFQEAKRDVGASGKH